MVLVFLPSDALSQHLLSYLGFSYLAFEVSLHGCSSKVQPLLLTLEERYLFTAAPPDLDRGVAPLGRRPWPRTWGCSSGPLLPCRSLALSVATPNLGWGVAPHGHASARSIASGLISQYYWESPQKPCTHVIEKHKAQCHAPGLSVTPVSPQLQPCPDAAAGPGSWAASPVTPGSSHPCPALCSSVSVTLGPQRQGAGEVPQGRVLFSMEKVVSLQTP